MHNTPRAIIFDLFGTLVYLKRNSRPYLGLCRAIGEPQRIRESLIVDAPTLAEFCDVLGKSHPSNLADLQNELDLDVASISLFPESKDVLNTLRNRGTRIAMISNLASPYKEPYFKLGLADLVDASLFSCDVGLAKPNARIYQLAIDALGLPAEQIWMVGDSQRSDVDGPNQIGIHGLHLDRSVQSGDSHIIHALTDVITKLG